MILLLLLCLAASRMTHTELQPCPEYSACLYHTRCSLDGEDIIIATTNREEYINRFAANCSDSETPPTTTQLFVRPISIHKWIFTLHYSYKNVGIRFGTSFTMIANKTEASFILPSTDKPLTSPFVRDGNVLTFTLHAADKNLFDIFTGSDIFYMEKEMKNGSTSSMQDLFWQEIQKLVNCLNILSIKHYFSVPCDPSLIIDGCTKETMNCSKLITSRNSVNCPIKEENLWQPADISWEKLESISCDEATKEWSLNIKDKHPLIMPKAGFTVQFRNPMLGQPQLPRTPIIRA
ncbi:hypothetical protein PENTCL1PPCAC_1827 [Pristionchus entomophagus]|uniref:Uncharacterized protein n=1 Tax=Pristionchus entomophagus TaxID=358040 RepID=A0AAV5SB50_9BILA|nr:hypothetical protein PENTCL1PPCAC_1827 [Pristionchus entomophagus]